MLIATVMAIMLIFGGGGSDYIVLPDDYMDILKVEMPVEEQREHVEKIANDLSEEVSDYIKRQEELMEEGRKLSREYAVDQAELDRILKEMLDNREKCQAKVLDRRFELVELMTEEQWKALWEPRKDEDD